MTPKVLKERKLKVAPHFFAGFYEGGIKEKTSLITAVGVVGSIRDCDSLGAGSKPVLLIKVKIMKIVLHKEIDEEEIDFYGRLEASKSDIKEELMLALNDELREIVDWCEIYTFVEDERDKNRKE